MNLNFEEKEEFIETINNIDFFVWIYLRMC